MRVNLSDGLNFSICEPPIAPPNLKRFTCALRCEKRSSCRSIRSYEKSDFVKARWNTFAWRTQFFHIWTPQSLHRNWSDSLALCNRKSEQLTEAFQGIKSLVWWKCGGMHCLTHPNFSFMNPQSLHQKSSDSLALRDPRSNQVAKAFETIKSLSWWKRLRIHICNLPGTANFSISQHPIAPPELERFSCASWFEKQSTCRSVWEY